MSEKQISISLDLIGPNPYQPRLNEDPAVVAEIAASIERNTMLQIPTARQVEGGRAQLAFGHTRLAAYKLLASQGKKEYETMPLIIRDLQELQMFELGVGENIKRRDLNPIEVATSMRVYLDTFHKTSEEAAEFFGVSAETVRGTVRLLGLPKEVQAKVASKELTIGVARSLLSVQKIAPDLVKEAVDEVLDKDNFGVYDDPDQAISSILDQAKYLVQMYDHNTPFRDVTPKKFPFKYLEPLTPHQAIKTLKLKSGKAEQEAIEPQIHLIEMGAEEDNPGLATLAKDEIEKLTVLIHPPQCTVCPFHTLVDRTHYCGLQDCYGRKTRAWKEKELQDASKTFSVPLYDPKDGKKVVLSSYDHQAMWKAKGPDLRLIEKVETDYSNWDGMDRRSASVVAVGKTAERLLKKEKKSGEAPAQEAKGETYAQRQQRTDLNNMKLARYASEVAIPLFVTVLDGIKSFGFLRSLEEAGDIYSGDWSDERDELKGMHRSPFWNDLAKEKPAKRMKIAKDVLILELLYHESDEHNCDDNKKPVSTFAKHLQKLAEDWGVNLPKTWLATAAEWDAKDLEEEQE